MLRGNLIDIVHKDYYYSQSKEISPVILDNILKSSLQGKYRDYMANFRGIDKKVLEENYMFYILDGEEEFDEIIPSLVDRDILGIQSGHFIKQTLRFVFPLMTPDKVILGWVGYDYEEESYKYLMSFSKFAEKGKLFFNWHNIHESYKEDVCIVVEGVFDSLRLNEIGLKNNIALMGKRITDFQKRVLNRFDSLILIPDNDLSGKKACEGWQKVLKPKQAIIDIKKGSYIKKTEGGEEEIVIKDIDDYLRNKGNKERFKNLYKKILQEFKDPFYGDRRYKI